MRAFMKVTVAGGFLFLGPLVMSAPRPRGAAGRGEAVQGRVQGFTFLGALPEP